MHRYVPSAVTLLLAALLILAGGCTRQATPAQPYLVLYAFMAEGELICEQMSLQSAEKHLGRLVVIGEISGKSIVLAESGVGMTNAAMSTQRMIDVYDPKAVIMTGIAGAIDTAVHIGDIVVCQNWIEHDYGYVGNEGFEHGELSVYLPDMDSISDVYSFLADSAMLSVAERLDKAELGLEKIGSREPRLLVGGVGVSGNTFIDSKEKREWLSDSFNALITDMETAAVAQVCTANDIPFIIFRSASDLAGGSGSETARDEMSEFFRVAAGNSSKVVVRFLGEL